MDILLDTSVIIAVLINEPEKTFILENTKGKAVVCCSSITAEIGNAFSAMFKRKVINLKTAQQAILSFNNLNLKLESFNLSNSIKIAENNNIYAYDAYLLELAQRKNLCLYTLDNKLFKLSEKIGINSLGGQT